MFGAELGPTEVVDRILRDVRERGDAAIRRYNEEIDGVSPTAGKLLLEVSREEIESARSEVDGSLLEALMFAAGRIRAFHEQQLVHSLKSFEAGGVGQVVRPLHRAGFYVPGTAAIYPSTVLMSVIPARVAGVSEVIMTTPVAPDGAVAPLKLVAAAIAGVEHSRGLSRVLVRLQDTTAQIRVRGAFVLLIGFVAIAENVDTDI